LDFFRMVRRRKRPLRLLGQIEKHKLKGNMKTNYLIYNELARFSGDYAHELKPYYAVYNSQGRFQARFLSHKRALAWVIANGMEWSAEIRKERASCN
jgi:hypothetical protein